MPVVVEKSGKGVARRLRLISKRIEDPSPAWPRVGSYISRQMRTQFATEGAHLGTPWQPLKPKYRLWKLKHGYSRKILVQSGKMRQSFVGRPMDIERYGKKTATFGSNDQKAIWHHNGTRRNGRRVNPPRPILNVTPQMAKGVTDIVTAYVIGKRGRML